MLSKCRCNLPPVTSTHPLTPPAFPFPLSIEQWVVLTYGPIKNWFYFLLLSRRHICRALRCDSEVWLWARQDVSPCGRRSSSRKTLTAAHRPCESLRRCFQAKLQSRNLRKKRRTIHLHLTLQRPRLCLLARHLMFVQHAAPLLQILCKKEEEATEAVKGGFPRHVRLSDGDASCSDNWAKKKKASFQEIPLEQFYWLTHCSDPNKRDALNSLDKSDWSSGLNSTYPHLTPQGQSDWSGPWIEVFVMDTDALMEESDVTFPAGVRLKLEVSWSHF